MQHYYAIAEAGDDGSWRISFPGRDGIASAADNAQQIVAQAQEALGSATMRGGLPPAIEDGALPPTDLSGLRKPAMVVVIPFAVPAAEPSTDEYRRLAHELEQANMALRAIETSTFWRATALPRRVVERLKRVARVRRHRDSMAGHSEVVVPTETPPPPHPVTGSGLGTASIARHDEWTRAVFGTEIPVPGVLFAVSFAPESPWGQKAHEALLDVELEYVEQLCWQLKKQNVEGALAEFGVFEGWWINRLFEISERVGLDRPVIGYDSFQGLSRPHSDFDEPYWTEGQYAASLDTVAHNVQQTKRARIKLIPGFFSDSLKRKEATSVGSIAYARIDCDIYEPALDCLRYLGPRLTHGAVLVLDEWPFRLDVGEGLAFHEWAPTVPHLCFEFLFFGTFKHFYARVWHRDRLIADGASIGGAA